MRRLFSVVRFPAFLAFLKSTMTGLRVEFINPFISAVIQTFEVMVGTKVERSVPTLKSSSQALYPISGIIGLTGAMSGTAVLTMSEAVALRIASVVLMSEYTKICPDVMDAVGELTNVIAGHAKSQLAEYKLSLSLPNVIHCDNAIIRFPEKSRPITIPFGTQWGPVAVEIGFAEP